MVRIHFSKFWIMLLPIFAFTFPSFSQDVNIDAPEKTHQMLIGIWRVDFPELKQKLDAESQNKLSQMDEKEQESVWMTTDSRIYLFEKDGSYLTTYVEDGAFIEQKGKWSIDSDQMMLTMEEEKGNHQFRLTFTERGMMWIPLIRSKEFFEVLFLNRLDL